MRMDDSVSIGKPEAALQSQAQSQCDHDVTMVILCQLTSGDFECGVPWQIDASKRGDSPCNGPSPA